MSKIPSLAGLILKGRFSFLMNSKKVEKQVISAKAGIHRVMELLDSRLRGNDILKRKWAFYETVIFE